MCHEAQANRLGDANFKSEGVLKKNVWTKSGGHAWGFLFNFSRVTETAFMTIELFIKSILKSLVILSM